MTDIEQPTKTEARASFTGKTLTHSQFEKAYAIAGIIHAEIRRTGSFADPLTHFSHAFKCGERFDTLRSESIVRDIFKARYGQTMNQMREALLNRETEIGDNARTLALKQAESIETLIRDGETMPFYRAYDEAATSLAETLDITQSGAKEMMKSAYSEAHGKDLYETGKAWEKAYHEPVREAARHERAAARSQMKSRNRSYA